MLPRKWCTQRRWEINLEQKASGSFSTLISPCELQGAEWHWFYYRRAPMTSWMSESADERERASDHSLAGCPSRALKDAERTLASVMWSPGWGDLGQGQVWGVKHTQLGHNTKEKGKSPHVHTLYKPSHTYTHTQCAVNTHLFVQTAWWWWRWWWRWCWPSPGCFQVTYIKCQPLCSFSPSSWIHMMHLFLILMSCLWQWGRERESRAASTVLPFFAEFYCLCLSHLQALVHKCSCVLSIHFYQLCGVDCTRRSLKVTVPREQQLFKLIYWYILHTHFAGITLVLVTDFYAWVDLMDS